MSDIAIEHCIMVLIIANASSILEGARADIRIEIMTFRD